jgi:hypothetical protein
MKRQPQERESIAQQAAKTWLPTLDPVAEAKITDLLTEVAATGANPVVELRNALAGWFGAQDHLVLPRPGPTMNSLPGGVAVEPLSPIQRPCLWPQRPKRRDCELFSSWLWRTAVAAGVPPRQFVRDEVAENYDDIDRDIAPATLQRLAGLSGQTARHLSAGLLVPNETALTLAEAAENELLRDGRFLLSGSGHDRQGRRQPLLQYCPLCLRLQGGAWFDRAWRLVPIAVCVDHESRLHDGCWQCRAPVSLLALRTADPVPRCASCGASLLDARCEPAKVARPRLQALTSLLRYVSTDMPCVERYMHLDRLAQVFPDNTASTELRTRTLESMRASNWISWFGAPAQEHHIETLRLLARNVHYDRINRLKVTRRRTAHLIRRSTALEDSSHSDAVTRRSAAA